MTLCISLPSTITAQWKLSKLEENPIKERFCRRCWSLGRADGEGMGHMVTLWRVGCSILLNIVVSVDTLLRRSCEWRMPPWKQGSLRCGSLSVGPASVQFQTLWWEFSAPLSFHCMFRDRVRGTWLIGRCSSEVHIHKCMSGSSVELLPKTYLPASYSQEKPPCRRAGACSGQRCGSAVLCWLY